MPSSNTIDIDSIHMHQALELAKLGRGFCAPNPAVGAIIMDDQGTLLSTGYHFQAGSPHAEIVALNHLKEPSLSRGATLYVTLEPCCHTGKTPPCTNALIAAGIKRIVYGYEDPNPIVQGKGSQLLNAAGIQCDYLPLPEIQSFYASYHFWTTTKKPWVTAKIAMTLNGKIANADGAPIQITGEALGQFTHYHRKHSDAILTTAKTIRNDNPRLNARLDNEIYSKAIYVIDRELTTPDTATIFSTAHSLTFFYGNNPDKTNLQRLQAKGARCIEVSQTENDLNLSDIISNIGHDGIHNLWVEAGGKLFSKLYQQQLLQHAFLYISPQWVSNGLSAFNQAVDFTSSAQSLRWEQIGNDVLCELHWYTSAE